MPEIDESLSENVFAALVIIILVYSTLRKIYKTFWVKEKETHKSRPF